MSPSTFRAAVQASYDVALFIPGDEGASGRTHGHGYRVEAVVECRSLDDSGFVVDFVWLEARLGAIARELDHHLLNELEPFHDTTPSAERQAEYFYGRLQPEIEARYGPRAWLERTRVIEVPGAWVEYEPGGQ